MDELLTACKNYLDITWEDPDGDEKLSGIMMRGKTYLDRIAGYPQDYEQEGAPRALLFDYARYVRANAFDEFMVNYLHELLALQIDAEVTHDTQTKTDL